MNVFSIIFFQSYTIGGSIFESGEFGILLNYSLVQNVSCTGSENSVSQCTVDEPTDSCLPWCPHGNIGLKCFASMSFI